MKRKIFNYCGYSVGLIAAVALYYAGASSVLDFTYHGHWYRFFVNVWYLLLIPLGSASMVLLVYLDYFKDKLQEREEEIEVMELEPPSPHKKRKKRKPKHNRRTPIIDVTTEHHGE